MLEWPDFIQRGRKRCGAWAVDWLPTVAGGPHQAGGRRRACSAAFSPSRAARRSDSSSVSQARRDGPRSCVLDGGQSVRNLSYNARIDHVFTDAHATVGIGDGGNEIGMGNLADQIPKVDTLVKLPCVTRTTELIITSVSNWGGYGLVAALSQLCGRDLLPSIEEERRLMTKTVDLGAVDGMSAVQEYKVDGFTFDENSETVQALHDYLSSHGISA